MKKQKLLLAALVAFSLTSCNSSVNLSSGLQLNKFYIYNGCVQDNKDKVLAQKGKDYFDYDHIVFTSKNEGYAESKTSSVYWSDYVDEIYGEWIVSYIEKYNFHYSYVDEDSILIRFSEYEINKYAYDSEGHHIEHDASTTTFYRTRILSVSKNCLATVQAATYLTYDVFKEDKTEDKLTDYYKNYQGNIQK